MNRFQRSWLLFKSSLTVMQRSPKLLLFPLLTAAFTCLVALLFVAPVALQRTGYSYLSGNHWEVVGNSFFRTGLVAEAEGSSGYSHRHVRGEAGGLKPVAVAYFAALYFTSMFCATFFNVAFYQQILNALNREPVSILGGLQFACSKWKLILMWTLFAGMVGFLIKMLEERFGFIGQWIMGLLGTAWSIACVFVIPVIVTEQATSNPLMVLKKSASTLTRTWGESMIGYAGVSLGGLLILFLSFFWLGTAMAVAVGLHLYWLTGMMVVGWVAGLVLWSYMLSVASQIFRCALFLYASQGTLPHPYTQDMMARAWKTKKQC